MSIDAVSAEEMATLLKDYREIVSAFVRASEHGRPAHSVLKDLHCWWPRSRLLRVAVDLPEKEGRAFLGR